MAKKARESKSLKERAVKNTGRMKILLAMAYKDGMIYIRQVDEELFIWDAVYKNQLYSSYVVITLTKGSTKLPDDIRDQAREMCYAGAVATIDHQRGDKISKEEAKNVELFEKSRAKVEASI
jgi:hypothetical protein